MRTVSIHCAIFAFVVLSFHAPAQARRIEAQKGKHYRLTKQHGPWMIMVASIADVPQDRKVDGISHMEAADRLVYELRKKGIPAYTISNREVMQQMQRQGGSNRLASALYRSQPDRISVIAGNYPSISDETAQQTLAWIKKFKPTTWNNGGIYKRNHKGPLEGAFLTINPLLSPQEVAAREHDPLLYTLNSGQPFSLLDSRGNYTLVVASFYGKALTTKANRTKFISAINRFKVADGALDNAAANANQLTGLLRKGAVQGSPTLRSQQFEAYVLHEKFRSVVCVGSFQSPNDPKLQRLAKLFGAKSQPNTNGNVHGEFLHVANPAGLKFPPVRTFAFDPAPQVLRIPKPQRR